jgi:parallel beta-helix repeat protein
MQLNPLFVFSSCLMLIVAVSIVELLPLPPLSYAQQNTDSTPCIIYDPSDRLITITCGSASLTDIDNQIKDANILHKENNGDDDDTVWLLNAGVIVTENVTFYINSTDTKWLKIMSDGNTEYAIEVYGSLKIDSVKITSWNPETNDYAITDDEEGQIPRPFIRVEEGATGTTDITNSELAYLGYAAQVKEDNHHRRSGLVYYGGNESIIRGNHIHHNMFGFYSAGVDGLILEDNHVHDNYVYGFDPHTGTHDMIIRNNTVHGDGHIGIICSLDCYNIIIENNEVYNSGDIAVMFSRNMYNSIAKNNYVHDETQCIFVSESHNNEIYNNTVSHCKNGIYLKHDSSNNKIHDNTIINATSNGILVNAGASDNIFSYNTIINATKFGINAKNSVSVGNTFESNNLINSKMRTK